MDCRYFINFIIVLASFLLAAVAIYNNDLTVIGLKKCEKLKICPNFKNSSRELICNLLSGNSTEDLKNPIKVDVTKKSFKKSIRKSNISSSTQLVIKRKQDKVKTRFGMKCSSAVECSLKNSVCRQGSCQCGGGFSYHQSNASCIKRFGMKCSSTTECSFKNYECRKGSCKCPIGFSFQPSNDSCVLRCGKYGDHFEVYPNYGIKEYNKKISFVKSRKSCIRKCLLQTSFTCITIEFRKRNFLNNCILSEISWFDVPETNRESDDVGWLFLQRHCADESYALEN